MKDLTAEIIVQLIVSGLALGFIYALVSIEYTIIFNATGLLNFSHDKLIMLGAYVFAGQFVLRMGAPPAVAVIATVAAMFLFGVLVATGIFNPLRNMASPVFAVIGTVILGRILTELARVIWGATPFTVPGFLKGIVKIGSIVIPRANIAIILVSAVIVTALQIFFKTTKMGKAMRCVQQNKTAATLMGINVTANINLTIALSAVICSAIGILVIPLFTIDLTIANMIGLKGFAAGVIGGFGYLPGAIAGGILIGILENLSTLVIPTLYKDCVAFVLLIVFLLVKPSGLLGHRQ
ncbi:branched-chain amino acid ABC transporter permease [Anaerotruncus colihominis]|uniref:branched-chain amino acid ABC transporter permease n=1 Tax=Anaerotruncus colihominis TaxID=169435 RepID=UPI000B385117|nr:branched-chain amino acid ABC transporter permease [Anaerotruncus colihominis]OUP72866.1 branched-chain amino acid ABC transporter permease [Anaerotruncus colihominis]